jgi:hypothetical protein
VGLGDRGVRLHTHPLASPTEHQFAGRRCALLNTERSARPSPAPAGGLFWLLACARRLHFRRCLRLLRRDVETLSAADTDDRLRIVAVHAELATPAMRALERLVHRGLPQRVNSTPERRDRCPKRKAPRLGVNAGLGFVCLEPAPWERANRSLENQRGWRESGSWSIRGEVPARGGPTAQKRRLVVTCHSAPACQRVHQIRTHSRMLCTRRCLAARQQPRRDFRIEGNCRSDP